MTHGLALNLVQRINFLLKLLDCTTGHLPHQKQLLCHLEGTSNSLIPLKPVLEAVWHMAQLLRSKPHSKATIPMRPAQLRSTGIQPSLSASSNYSRRTSVDLPELNRPSHSRSRSIIKTTVSLGPDSGSIDISQVYVPHFGICHSRKLSRSLTAAPILLNHQYASLYLIHVSVQHQLSSLCFLSSDFVTSPILWYTLPHSPAS